MKKILALVFVLLIFFSGCIENRMASENFIDCYEDRSIDYIWLPTGDGIDRSLMLELKEACKERCIANSFEDGTIEINTELSEEICPMVETKKINDVCLCEEHKYLVKPDGSKVGLPHTVKISIYSEEGLE